MRWLRAVGNVRSFAAFMPRRPFTLSVRRTALLALALLPACGKQEDPRARESTTEAAAETARAADAKALSKKLAAFTGARTKVVWSQYQKDTATDPRSNNTGHLLMGLDTQDPLGARAVSAKPDNYTRPILSSDGETILFTQKTVTWDAQDAKHYSVSILRTDWKGSAPSKINDGYAVDTWKDPKTRIEWVYAVRDIIASPAVSLQAKKLIRFQLDHPDEEELVWDQTPVSPDNIQLSRNGRRASGQFPWPDAGHFVLGETSTFTKRGTGSWPSLAPDNSYVSWILDDQNQNLTLFPADDAAPWSVPLTASGDLSKGSINHPSWSNHPRFIALTGPYLPAANPSEGSAIGTGGLSSEVFIGKFSEKLDQIEDWFRITDNALNDNYPDVWIEGGDTAALATFAQASDAPPAAPVTPWPASQEGLVFLWQRGDAKNHLALSGGRDLDCTLDLHGAARFGRSHEMLLDAGTFEPKADVTTIIADALQSAMPLAVGFILHIEGEVKSAHGTLATFPHLRLTLRDGIISAETSSGIIGVGPVQGSVCHVTASAGDTGYSVTLQEADGKSTTKISAARPRQAPGRPVVVSFGGGSGAGIGMSHVTVFARKLTADEIQANASVLASLPVPTLSTTLKLRGKLLQSSSPPAPGSGGAHGGALIESLYEITKVIEGEASAKQILVRHWAVMDGKPVRGLPRKTGLEYDLLVQPFSDHPQFKSIPCPALDPKPALEPWLDITTPSVR